MQVQESSKQILKKIFSNPEQHMMGGKPTLTVRDTDFRDNLEGYYAMVELGIVPKSSNIFDYVVHSKASNREVLRVSGVDTIMRLDEAIDGQLSKPAPKSAVQAPQAGVGKIVWQPSPLIEHTAEPATTAPQAGGGKINWQPSPLRPKL